MSIFDLFWRKPDIKATHQTEVQAKATSPAIPHVMPHQVPVRWSDMSAVDMAWRSATNTVNPNRTLYLDFCERARQTDDRLAALLQNRYQAILSRRFAFVDSKGRVNKKVTQAFERSWFRQFALLVLEASIYGHSLINIKEIDDNGYPTRIELINRHHVCPELQLIKVNVSDQTGIDYTSPALAPWLVEVGDRHDLGLMMRAMRQIIIRSASTGGWMGFAELFGNPIRIGHSDATNPEQRMILLKMLEQMGSNAYGLFGGSDKVEFHQMNANNAPYEALVAHAEDSLALLFLGQLLTTGDGASRALGEVHERVSLTIYEGQSLMVEDAVNEQLLPKLIALGCTKLNGLRFQYDRGIDSNLFDRALAAKQAGFNVSAQWLMDEFGIQIATDQADEAAQPAKGAKRIESDKADQSDDED